MVGGSLVVGSVAVCYTGNIMKTLEDFVRPGTHLTHCCVLHGCKYGEGKKGCPVEAKVAVQAYMCEYCEAPDDLRARIKSLKRELRKVEALQAKVDAEGFDPYTNPDLA